MPVSEGTLLGLRDPFVASELLVDVAVDLLKHVPAEDSTFEHNSESSVRRRDGSSGTSGIVEGCGQISSSTAAIPTSMSSLVMLNTM